MAETVYYSDFDVNLRMNPVTKDVIKKTNIQAIRQALKLLLMTSYYDRKFAPDIGTALRDLLFKQLDDFTLYSVSEQLKKSIGAYEPRIHIDELTCTVSEINRFQVEIKITYTILAIGKTDTYVYSINRIR